MTKIAFVLGTRPEIIKTYPCIKYCEANNIDHFVVFTDQHYDEKMRDVFFQELGLSIPKYSLGVGSGSHAKMLASMLVSIESVFEKEHPDTVVVQGDTNTVLAGALVAVKMGVKVAHIEAGLRSYDRSMPEEHNRVVTDHISDYLFAPTIKQADILLSEGISKNSVYVTGNTIVDAVLEISKNVNKSNYDKKFILLTSHRPSNTDSEENFLEILNAVQELCEAQDLICIFPVHPRLKSKFDLIDSYNCIKRIEPLGYCDLLSHITNSEVVLTDSGGIQEESCILQKKCLVLRTNTERPETLEVGGAILLSDIKKSDILKKYYELQARNVEWTNPFGDGKSAERIIKIIEGEL